MITCASNADYSVILIDAHIGMLQQTRRHSYICHLLGIRELVLVINKMDLVDFSQEIFERIVLDYQSFSCKIGIESFSAIPVSGLKGDNITEKSNNTPWYRGPALLSFLENIDIGYKQTQIDPFRMPIQWVNRPNSKFRGYAGRITTGKINLGDSIRIQPSGQQSAVKRIVNYSGDLDHAISGQSVTLVFEDDVDCSRGSIVSISDSPLEVSDQFEATLVWMDKSSLIPGRSYYLKIASQTISATVSEPKYKINVNTFEKMAAKTLNLNSIGVANVTTDRAIPFSTYKEDRNLGSFILIDKISNSTACAGLINFGLRRAQNIHWQTTDITRENRSNQKNQKPKIIWMTGISGAGKSTIANAVEKKLVTLNKHTFLLDGDNIRHGLNKDLGFTDSDRIENIRRVGEVARLMADAGLIVITAFISPFQSEREMVRKMMKKNEFIEVFIKVPLAEAEKRDVKGLYAKARAGTLKNFTGVDSPYEVPENPEIIIDTTKVTANKAADFIVNYITSELNPGPNDN